MSNAKLFLLAIACAVGCVSMQAQTPDANKPSVILENKEKPPKASSARTISGLVKDQNDNPVRGAIVQLKNMKTSKIVAFPTKEDGKFVFRELYMDVDYELTAMHDNITSPVKKVSIYETRRDVVLTFKLEPPAKESQ